MKLIITTSGLPIIVDDEDFEELNHLTWSAGQVGKRGKFYAYAEIDGRRRSMQRHLLKLSVGDKRMADHINGCTLDNRRENLRIVSAQQNAWNIVFHKKNSSGLRGICFHTRSGRWQARIYVDRKRISLGYFDTKEEAAAAYAGKHAEITKGLFDDSQR